MSALSWQQRLEAAEDEHEIVALARDYAAQFEHWEIAMLPSECRPGKFHDASDVTSYAFTLVRSECGEESDAAPVIRKLAGFYSSASIRLSQLLASGAAGDDSRGPS